MSGLGPAGRSKALSTSLTLALVEGVAIPHLAAKVNSTSMAGLIGRAKIGDTAASPIGRSRTLKRHTPRTRLGDCQFLVASRRARVGYVLNGLHSNCRYDVSGGGNALFRCAASPRPRRAGDFNFVPDVFAELGGSAC